MELPRDYPRALWAFTGVWLASAISNLFMRGFDWLSLVLFELGLLPILLIFLCRSRLAQIIFTACTFIDLAILSSAITPSFIANQTILAGDLVLRTILLDGLALLLLWMPSVRRFLVPTKSDWRAGLFTFNLALPASAIAAVVYLATTIPLELVVGAFAAVLSSIFFLSKKKLAGGDITPES